jgi:ABC-2 type transport system ATP-binding protein
MGAEDIGPAAEIDHLSYSYGAVAVLQGISLNLFAGEITVLIGRNGAGKTTLLRCLAGWSRATVGDVRLGGVSIGKNERLARTKVVLVPDTPTFYDELTAWEHLQIVAQLHRLAAWQGRAAQLLNVFALNTQQEAYPFTFSRGMRHKLALSMALLLSPPLLLLDEPFAPLDPQSAVDLWAELQALRNTGTAVLLSSHALPGEAYPDRYVVIDGGQIITQVTREQFTRSPEAQRSVLSVLQQALVEQTQANHDQ